MKVLVITDLNIYAIGHSFVRALKKMGHETVTFDLQNAISKHVKFKIFGKKIHSFWPVEAWERKGNRDLAVFAQHFQPDHIIVSGNVPIMYGTLAFWKSISKDLVTTLFWPDTLTNLQQVQLNCALLYDQIASYSKTTLPIFTQLGFKNPIWIPFAGDTEFLGSPNAVKDRIFDFDLTFIGGWRPEREKSMLTILKAFPNLKIGIRGNNWMKYCKNTEIKNLVNPKSIYGVGYGDFIRNSRINLNVIDDTNYPAANMRFFEIPAAGALQLSSSCPEQEGIFKDGEQVFYFHSEKDLLSKIEYIIDNPEQSNQVRKNAFDLVTSKHTYVERMQEMLNLNLKK